MPWRATIMLFSALAFFGEGARAAVIVGLHASTRAAYGSFFDPENGGANTNSFSSGELMRNSVSFADTQTKTGAKCSAKSDVLFTVEIGDLSGRITGRSVLDGDTAVVGFPSGADTSGFGVLEWRDTYTVTSPIHPLGTMVDPAVSFRVDGEISGSGNFDPNNQNKVEGFLFSPGGIIELTRAGNIGLFSHVDSRPFRVAVGGTFELRSVLQLTADTLAFFNPDPDNGGFEPVSTIELRGASEVALASIQPNVFFQSESGVAIPTALPEKVNEVGWLIPVLMLPLQDD